MKIASEIYRKKEGDYSIKCHFQQFNRGCQICW